MTPEISALIKEAEVTLAALAGWHSEKLPLGAAQQISDLIRRLHETAEQTHP